MRALILGAVALTLLVGCPSTIRYAPQATDDVVLFNEERASTRTERVGVTVAFDAMEWAPSTLRGRVVGFRVAIRNYGADPLPLDPQYFILIDGEGNQYSPVSPNQLAQFGITARPHYGPRVGVGIGLGYGHYGHPHPSRRHHGWGTWGLGPSGWYDTYGYDPRFIRTVFARSLFPTSPLSPEARASGLIYFRGEFEEPQQLYLELRLPGEPVRRFPFVRE